MATALILAGGVGKRIGGDKPSVKLDGAPMLQWVIDAVDRVADCILFSIAPGQELPDVRCSASAYLCEDALPGRGPMTGIFSGLQASEEDYVLSVPCDAPLLQPALLELLWSCRRGYDAVVPVVGGRQHPLVGVYGRSCMTPMGIALNSGDLSMRALLRGLNVRYVSEEEVRQADPVLRSFINVNTPRDLASVVAHLAVA